MDNKARFIEARTLRGFHDKLPAEALAKGRMLEKLRRVFESFGYVPIETPHIEFKEILVKEASDEIQKQLYAFKDSGDREIGLRFDLTVPFARFIVQHRAEVGVPFKRYAIGEVFRGERPQAGRYREFTQCDFDLVGTKSTSADAEIVQVICASMRALGIGDFVVRINNRKIMNGLAEHFGLAERSADMLRVVDKLDKIGADAVREDLRSEVSMKDEDIDALFNLIEISKKYSGAELFEKLGSFKELNAQVQSGLEELEELVSILNAVGLSKEYYAIDLSIARGLGYYTGIVYETFLRKIPEIGSVCSGGRYDNLTMTFAPEALPGVGSSFGVDRLIAALQELGLVEKTATASHVLLLNERPEDQRLLHSIAAKFRTKGINAEVYPEAAKLKKQFEYQERMGHPYVLFVQCNEVGEASFVLRNTKTREQSVFESIEELIGKGKALMLH